MPSFLGTFNKSQFERFFAFVQANTEGVDDRIAHLTAEIGRVGNLQFQYVNGQPIGYTTGAKTSYIAKLVAAYEVLGGDVLHDLNIRSREQSVYALPGTETNPSQMMSNGEIMGTQGLADSTTALLMQQAKAWVPEVLHYRREYLERKVRRSVDYVDQLTNEIGILKALRGDKDADGSLDNIRAQIEEVMADETYRPVYDDKGSDPSGKGTHAPMAGFSSGPDRKANDTYNRDSKGFLVPGQKA